MPRRKYIYDYPRPMVTADCVLFRIHEGQLEVLLVRRAKEPFAGAWALPGGFVDYGESLEQAAVREAREETYLEVSLTKQFHTYSDPNRDPRHHSVTTVYLATSHGFPKAGDDAKGIGVYMRSQLPAPIVFDHERILNDYFRYREGRLVWSYDSISL